jgi:hypothetical protein
VALDGHPPKPRPELEHVAAAPDLILADNAQHVLPGQREQWALSRRELRPDTGDREPNEYQPIHIAMSHAPCCLPAQNVQLIA